MVRIRLDVLLFERGLADSRAQAQRLVMAGQVRVDGQVVLKSATHVQSGADIEVNRGPRYASRGGEKLEAALKAFNLDISRRICADVGSSTGGFTDCLLQAGAARVYAIDVGTGILHWKLRQDPRVVVMERTNARYLELLPERVSLVTVDVSFISIKALLPVFTKWFRMEGGEVIALVKPQFEAGRAQVSRGGGVIRDSAIHTEVLSDVLAFAQECGYGARGLIRSPLLGPKGNVEFLAWLEYLSKDGRDIGDLIVQAAQ